MKILMVNKFLYPNGGSETYIFRIGACLKKNGHEVQYFGMEHEGRCVGNAAHAYTSDMDFHGGSRLSKLTYPIKTIYSVEARKKIRLVLDDFQPDIVHLNNFNYQLTPSIILEVRKWSRQTGHICRIVYTAHDYQLVCPNHMMNNPNTRQNCERCLSGSPLSCVKGSCIHGSRARSLIGATEAMYWRKRQVYRQIDAIICPSAFMKEKMDANPALRGRSVVLYNFSEPVEWKAVQKKNYVLYFGRYSEEKGIRTLLNVCRELPDIPFVFAGSGPLEKEVSAVPNVRNVGFQTGEALQTLIREARFSVYPSEWYENCPFSVIESLQLETPVLGANIGGIPELIEAGKTGELFESGNQTCLKRKIRMLWKNRALTDTYSKNCKEVRFDTAEIYCRRLIKIYQGIREV